MTTEDSRRPIYRKNTNCTCGWDVKFGYGVAFTLAVFEVKRLLVLALEIFAEWQVIRFAGGFQPVVLTLAEVALGLPCALITVRTIRRRNLPSFRLKTKLVLRCLLIIIIICTAMNAATLASIGYHVSVRQKTLVDVFNTSMRLYVSVASYKYAIDEIQFVLQCCGHTSYTDWFLFDWQMVCRFVPLQTSSPRIRCTAAPFTIIGTLPRPYVQQFSSVEKSIWRKKTMRRRPLSTNDVDIKENKKLRRSSSILNYRNCNTWDVAKIKPSVHEEHRISVKCLRNKRTR
ncbi:PRPH2 protein [Camponotus japonicus]